MKIHPIYMNALERIKCFDPSQACWLSRALSFVSLILSDEEEPGAVRFNALLYGLELAWLDGKKFYGRNWAQKKNTQKNTLRI